MDDYKEHLRRLAVHDERLVEVIVSDDQAPTASSIDDKTLALVRVAATIAGDAAPSAFQHAVSVARGWLRGVLPGNAGRSTPIFPARR